MKQGNGNHRLPREVDRSARDLRRARKEKRSFWRYVYLLGAGGWLFVIPVVGGAYLGRYLDRAYGDAGISWTITLLVLGIAFGLYNVWRFFAKDFRP